MLDIFQFKRGRQKLASAHSHLYDIQKHVSVCLTGDQRKDDSKEYRCLQKIVIKYVIFFPMILETLRSNKSACM